MTSAPSATAWGSPTATKHALLIHGLTSSSHTWHRVASSLAAQGTTRSFYRKITVLVGAQSYQTTWLPLPTSSGMDPGCHSTDYHYDSIAKDFRPYLEARNYSLIIGHSVGTATTLSLFPHLLPSHPTAILLIDPPMQQTSEKLDFLDGMFTDSCINVKPAEAHGAENPLWTCEDSIYRELGTRLCSIEAIHELAYSRQQNRPWYFFDYFNAVPEKWKVTVVVADPAIYKICTVEDFHPYPHIRPVVIPGAGHWIQYEFPEVSSRRH